MSQWEWVSHAPRMKVEDGVVISMRKLEEGIWNKGNVFLVNQDVSHFSRLLAPLHPPGDAAAAAAVVVLPVPEAVSTEPPWKWAWDRSKWHPKEEEEQGEEAERRWGRL